MSGCSLEHTHATRSDRCPACGHTPQAISMLQRDLEAASRRADVSAVLPFQALTLRERVIAELSFPLLDKGTDAVTIGDVRQIADRIVALIAEQSEDSESLRRENQALSEQLDAALRDYRELQSRMKQAKDSQ